MFREEETEERGRSRERDHDRDREKVRENEREKERDYREETGFKDNELWIQEHTKLYIGNASFSDDEISKEAQ